MKTENKYQVQVYKLGAYCIGVYKFKTIKEAREFIKTESDKKTNELKTYELYDLKTKNEIQ